MNHHGTNEREGSHDSGQIEADMNSSSFWAADELSHEVNDGVQESATSTSTDSGEQYLEHEAKEVSPSVPGAKDTMATIREVGKQLSTQLGQSLSDFSRHISLLGANMISETADAVKRTIPVVFWPIKWGLAVSIVLYICALVFVQIFIGIEGLLCTPKILSGPLRSFGMCDTPLEPVKEPALTNETLNIEGNTFMGIICSVPVLNIPLNQMDLCESSKHLPTQNLLSAPQVYNSLADLQLQAGHGGELRKYLREGGNAIVHLRSAVEVSTLDNKEPLMSHLTTIADTVRPLGRNLSKFGGKVHALVDSVKGNNERAFNGLREISKLIDKHEAQNYKLLHIVDPLYLFHHGPDIPKQKRERVTEDFLRVAKTIATEIPELIRILLTLEKDLTEIESHMDQIGSLEAAESKVAGEKERSRQSRSTLTYLWHMVTGEEERQMELFKHDDQLLESIGQMQKEGKDIISKSLNILWDMEANLDTLGESHSKILLQEKEELEYLMDVIDGAVKRLSSTGLDPSRETATMIEGS